VFHTHGMYGFSRRSFKRNIVALWHGMPIKCIGWLNHKSPNAFQTFGTLHIASSHFFRYIIANSFRASPNDVLVCQQPRCDVLTHESARSHTNADIRDQLGLPGDRKLILWMPTYRTEPTAQPIHQVKLHSFLDDLGEKKLSALNTAAGAINAIVLIKLHPMDRLNEFDVPMTYDNFRLIKSPDWQRLGIPLYDLIAVSDALISDISSILIDYLITGRPIGIFGLKPSTYPRDTTFPLAYILNSSRYQLLENDIDCLAFMQSVAVAPGYHADNDIAQIFHEDFKEQGAEKILEVLKL